MKNMNRNITDWHDRDVKVLNEEYLAVLGIFAAIVAAVLIVAAL